MLAIDRSGLHIHSGLNAIRRCTSHEDRGISTDGIGRDVLLWAMGAVIDQLDIVLRVRLIGSVDR